MSRDVTIVLRSSQRYPRQEPEEMELTVHGKLYFRGGSVFISYEESAMTGMENTRTTLKVEPGGWRSSAREKTTAACAFRKGCAMRAPTAPPTVFCSWPR